MFLKKRVGKEVQIGRQAEGGGEEARDDGCKQRDEKTDSCQQ